MVVDSVLDVEDAIDFSKFFGVFSEFNSQNFTFISLSVFYFLFVLLSLIYFIKLVRVNPYIWKMNTKLKAFILTIFCLSLVLFVFSVILPSVAARLFFSISTCLISGGTLYFLYKIHEEIL